MRPHVPMVFLVLLLLGAGHVASQSIEDVGEIIEDIDFGIVLLLILGIFITCYKDERGIRSGMPFGAFSTGWNCRRVSPTVLTGVALCGVFAFALVLRLINLDRLDPYTDESAHLISANRHRLGYPFTYDRASVISVIVYWIWKCAAPDTFSQFLYWARFPGVVFGALAIVPLFFLAKRISTPVALIACVLWSVSPWAIGISKCVGECAFYPLFILVVLIAFVHVADVARKRGRPRPKKLVVAGLVLLVFTVAALWDARSTLKVGFIVLAGALVGLFVESVVHRAADGDKRLLWYGAAAVLMILAAVIAVDCVSIPSSGYKIDHRYLRVFLSADSTVPTMWWSGYPLTGKIVAVFIFTGCIGAVMKRSYDYFLFFIAVILTMLYFYLFFDRYFKPRYCFYVLPLFTIVVAAGIVELLKLIMVFQKWPSRIGAGLVLLLFLFTVFHYKNTNAAVYPKLTNPMEKRVRYARRSTGYFGVTGEYHQGMRLVGQYLKPRVSQEDVFITTVFQPVLELELGVAPNRIFYFDAKKENVVQHVENLVNRHGQGWMILDYRRNGGMVERRFTKEKKAPFKLGERTVRLEADRHEAQIFRWRGR